MAIGPRDLRAMSLGEFGDTVAAFNLANAEDGPTLTDGEADDLLARMGEET